MMLFRFTNFLFLVFSTSLITAQELLPNPGFEEVTGCPGASVFLKNTIGWHRIPKHKGTPDQFYADCDYNGLENPMAPGQRPFAGKGYVGCFAFGDNLREYFTAELLQPLVKDSVYHLEFYVLPAMGYGTAINSFGVHFSNVEPSGMETLGTVGLDEHIGNPANRLITDTVNWTPIIGDYKAKGGERYITFGNFRIDAATQNKVIKTNCILPGRCYMLVDGLVFTKKGQDCTNNVNITSCAPDTTKYHDTRKQVEKEEFHSNTSQIRISIWDHKREDGDTVMLVLNDEVLLNQHPITHTRKYIDLDLEPGDYYLRLIALNLGEIPPSTAAINISNKKRSNTIILNSDMTTTEYIHIKVE